MLDIVLDPFVHLSQSDSSTPSSTHSSLLIVIIPPLLPPLIISIPQPIPILLHIVPKPLHIPDLLPRPARDILRRVFYILHSIVPFTLDALTKIIEALLDILRYLLDFADAAAGPLGGVGGEVGSGLLEAGGGGLEVLFYGCGVCVSWGDLFLEVLSGGLLMSSPSCISSAPAPRPRAAPPTPHAAALLWDFFSSWFSEEYWPCCWL